MLLEGQLDDEVADEFALPEESELSASLSPLSPRRVSTWSVDEDDPPPPPLQEIKRRLK